MVPDVDESSSMTFRTEILPERGRQFLPIEREPNPVAAVGVECFSTTFFSPSKRKFPKLSSDTGVNKSMTSKPERMLLDSHEPLQ